MDNNTKSGFGVVFQSVMRNRLLTPEAKAIYAYLSSFAGNGDSCFPSAETMRKELCMSKNRLMKHMGQLVAAGVIEKKGSVTATSMGGIFTGFCMGRGSKKTEVFILERSKMKQMKRSKFERSKTKPLI